MIPRAPRLFGRDRDLAIVRAAIEEGSTAITGPAGVGKTELALHLAATSEREVVWASVDRAWDGDDVRATIARALGISLRTRDPEEGRAAIVRAASARSDILFVIDGAEACLEECFAFSRLARTLVVSRAPIDDAHAIDPLDGESAVEMFSALAGIEPGSSERARARRALSRVCDGSPAAIELLAGAGAIEDLDDDVIEWAIARLPEDARFALACAAVFERPFSFDGFERVSRGASSDVLTRLADARLVRVSSRTASMERMIRAAALASLDDDEHRALLSRHASFVADRALASLRAFEGESPTDPPEAEELHAAHATALVDPDLPRDRVCALALAMVLADPSRASIIELDRLDATIAVAEGAPLAGRVRIARAALARSLGRPSEASHGFHLLRELARASGERLLEARALLGLGDLALDAGLIDEALAHHEEALARGALDAPHLLAHVLPSLARGRRAHGDLDDAALLLERAIAAEGRGGAPHARALLHVELARVRLDQGRTGEACALLERTVSRLEGRALARALTVLGRARDDRPLLERALRASRAAAAPRSEAEACLALATHDLLLGDLGSAKNHALAAIDLSAVNGDLVSAARGAGCLGVVLATLDVRGEAEAAFVTASSCGDRWVLAAIEIQRGHLDLAHARLARVRGDHVAAEELEARARGKSAGKGEEARAAARVLARALEGQGAMAIDLATHLEKRPTLRRLFEALVRRRIEQPGALLALDDLLAAGWPGERFPRKVGKDRLHTSLATLRDLGLRTALLSDEAGFRLSPEIPLFLR